MFPPIFGLAAAGAFFGGAAVIAIAPAICEHRWVQRNAVYVGVAGVFIGAAIGAAIGALIS